ncbi:MAG TPA: hypothetical protein VFI11_13355 [Anaerolineales bacterium]|nr:hypothetical protein [Anaerolineales bacterium]
MENLDLIDWRMVGFAALWIAGLAVILSALGFAIYHATAQGRRFREEISRPGFAAAINLGLMTFCLGQLGASQAWWETTLWIALAASFGGYVLAALGRLRLEKSL